MLVRCGMKDQLGAIFFTNAYDAFGKTQIGNNRNNQARRFRRSICCLHFVVGGFRQFLIDSLQFIRNFKDRILTVTKHHQLRWLVTQNLAT